MSGRSSPRRGAARALQALFSAAAVVLCAPAAGDTFLLPVDGGDLVGSTRTVVTVHEDTFSDLALRFNQGYREMKSANPDVDPWLPGAGTQVLIPSAYLLPRAPREGIVVNVPEMRLYFYPRPGRGEQPVVVTHPISIGRQDWRTPKGTTKVVAKAVEPAWYPPESIREEHAAEGRPLPRVVPPGPDNPLGKYALRLGLPGYLIHGTNRIYGIGMRVTHGCIRMYPHDIERLFPQVPVGTPVHIVSQPYKVGLAGERLYVEVHPPLEGEGGGEAPYRSIVALVIERVGKRPTTIDWDALKEAVTAQRGVPVLIGQVQPAPATVQADASTGP